jgi:Ca2+:H+ antiporter
VVSFSTEAVGERFGPALTGVLQSTLGNLPELFVVLFALSAGELVVAQYSILGSLFANALLVLGLVILAGSRAAGGTMRFGARLPNDTATLLLLAVFIISLLGVSDQRGRSGEPHQVEISAIGAVVLLAVYGVWLFFYLRDRRRASSDAGAFRSGFGRPARGRGVAAAFVSDWFVGSLAPAIESLGISEEFTGLVIVGIAGNAVENVVGVVLAHKGQNDLAISVVKNSVAQIAVFLFPLLVLLSLFLETRLTFVLPTVYIARPVPDGHLCLADVRRTVKLRPSKGLRSSASTSSSPCLPSTNERHPRQPRGLGRRGPAGGVGDRRRDGAIHAA